MKIVFRLMEIAIGIFGLFFMSGTLTTILTPQDSETAPMVQVIGAGLGLFALISLLSVRGSIAQIFWLYWPVVLPVLFAVLSLVWSDDLFLTVRRAGSLGLTTAFAFWLAFRFTSVQIMRLLLILAVTVVLANFAFIQFNPSLGIHQVYDLVASNHAGRWRGLFGHKNDFARLIAFAVTILVLGLFYGAGNGYKRLLILPIIVLAVFMIYKAGSSQALLLVTVVPGVMIIFMIMRSMSPSARSLAIVFSIPFAITTVLSVQYILEYVLGLLGRDLTFTGRTVIWEGVMIALRGHEFLGGGYGAGWDMIQPRLTALTGFEVGHAHNGFFDLAVDIGIVGLVLTMIPMLWVGVYAFRNLMKGIRPEISAIALAIVAFSVVGNFPGSFLLLHNSIYWVLLVVTFSKLRDLQNAGSRGGAFGRAPQFSLAGYPQLSGGRG